MIPAPFKEIPDMGVSWATDEAIKLGFYIGNPEWVNLGQGQPELGEMEGAPPRIHTMVVELSDNAYGPLNGSRDLQEAIAAHYNRLYRRGKTSRYKAENVSIAMGGRLVLTRICTMLGDVRLGYKTPEYPAYAKILHQHKGKIDATRVQTNKESNFRLSPQEFAGAIHAHQLDAFLFSNPCNPSGDVVQGVELDAFRKAAVESNCALIIDEIYSQYIYQADKPAPGPVSMAAYIEDVDKEEILLVDGLTKSFRYPGWRLAWCVGPVHLIENLGRVGSAIDGGASLPVQRAALRILEPEVADKEGNAIRHGFCRKRNLMMNGLQDMGIDCREGPQGSFYIWGDLSGLPKPLQDSLSFFQEALKVKVMVVPGPKFDIYPGQTKELSARFNNFVRFSFGPEEPVLAEGLKRLKMILGKS